uniref:Uncharacterized protein n=1 Tax=Timema cristinae TaxID=61476 RepID=A0A7R9DGF1_TIMCR|nr:unnamed protein product [Timema cristinae]
MSNKSSYNAHVQLCIKEWKWNRRQCTFIILDRLIYEVSKDEIAAMIGDTNLFFHSSEDCEDCVKVAEAEIMIAEVASRGKRRGWEALLLMLRYAGKGKEYEAEVEASEFAEMSSTSKSSSSSKAFPISSFGQRDPVTTVMARNEWLNTPTMRNTENTRAGERDCLKVIVRKFGFQSSQGHVDP